MQFGQEKRKPVEATLILLICSRSAPDAGTLAPFRSFKLALKFSREGPSSPLLARSRKNLAPASHGQRFEREAASKPSSKILIEGKKRTAPKQ